MGELEKKFLGLLQLAVQAQASDVHMMTGQPPALRSPSGLAVAELPPYSAEEMLALCQFMVKGTGLPAGPGEMQDVDGSFEVKGLGRFRFNVYRAISGLGAVLRVVSQRVPTIGELNLPPVLCKIAEANRGLILVTGATGSGKSSTLAAMIDHLNSNQSLHILTIEDPIEFVHSQKKSRISQREIGRDTRSFALALRSALRQDPDVILVGEMRDYETLDVALKAAETGHLVFSTVHTSDAMKTIGRLISLFPAAEQQAARNRLADNLHAVISQRLVPGTGSAKIVAQEILVNNLGIAECIMSEKKTAEIPTFIEKGREVSGMQTFDQHLAELVRRELVTAEVALSFASNPSDFQRNLSFGSTALEDGESIESLRVESESPALEQGTEPPTVKGEGIKPLPEAPSSVKIPKLPGAA
jgi:twitching motility protein PilT